MSMSADLFHWQNACVHCLVSLIRFHLFHSLLKTMYLNERAVHYLKFTITNILIIGFLHLSLQSKDSSKTTPYKEVEKNGERSFAKTNQ